LIKEFEMKHSSIIVGLLVGLLASVLIGAAMAAAAVLAVGRDLVATAKTARKSTSTDVRPGRDTEDARLPEEDGALEGLRPAA
jgi:hypothetical protein